MSPIKTTLLVVAILILVSIYSITLFAVLHPHTSAAYRAYFINHSSIEWEGAKYPGAPEQGMVFRRNGVPSWVEFIFGLSSPDGWGRWTDEDLDSAAGLVFSRSFNGQLCVDFTARAVPWVVGKNLTVQMGEQRHAIQIAGSGLTSYRVQFTDLPPSDRLELLLPGKLPRAIDMQPSTGDARRLALNLATLRILPGACPAVSR